MTDYTKTTDFTSKDSLPSGDSGKIIRGAEFGTEFDNIQTAVNSKSNIDNPSFTGNITVTGTVDGRDIAADGTKLDTIETSADVTDTANVTAAGAVMDSELTDITAVKALNQGVATTDSPTFAAVTSTGNVTVGGTVDGRDVAADGTKLDTVETNADVTDATNVTAAGALMDSEVTNLDQVKTFDSSDYATAAQGTTADNALPKTGGAMTGAITTNSTFDGRDVATDGTKLDGIEASADVTDTANVTAAGALMDSELTSEASVKALNQGVATTDSPTFAGVTANGTVEFDGLSGTGAVTVTDILDQDDMSGNSATALATQQSIKAYVDSQVATSDTLAEVLANGNTTGGTDISLASSDITGTGNIDITGTVTADGLYLDAANSEAIIGANASYQGKIKYNDGTGELEFRNTFDSTLRGYVFYRGSTDKTALRLDGNGDISFYEDTGTTPKFFWDASAESLGIGTSSVAFAGGGAGIHVNHGSIPEIKLTNSTTGSGAGDGTALQANGNNFNIINRESGNILFSTAATERMRIDSTGIDVTGTATMDGLTSAGDAAITGGSSGSTVLTLTSNALADTPLMVFQRTGGAVAGKLAYEDTNTAMSFGTTTAHELKFLTSNTERMQIDASGNVGIGTSSPVVKLAVKSSQEQLTLSEGDARGATFDYRSSTGNLNIATNGINARTNPQFTLDLNGNVGIGTSSPITTLQVDGLSDGGALNVASLTNTGTAANTSSRLLFIQGGNTDRGAYVGGLNESTSGQPTSLVFGTSASYSAPTERMRIDSNGSVGINNTVASTINSSSGLGNLVVGSGSGNEGITIYTGSSNYGGLNFADATSGGGSYAGYIKFDHSDNSFGHFIGNTERMRIDSSGNVGIGESNPQFNLHIKGSGDTGIQLTKDGVIASRVSAVTSGLSFGVDGANGTTERMRIDSSGNVGIGTSSPSAPLHVGKSGAAAELWLQRIDGYNPVKLFGSTLGDGQGFKINVNSNDAFAIDSSGNVGIGTSSPSAFLSFGANIPSNGQTLHTYHSGNIRSGLGIVSGVHRLFTDSGSALSFGQVSTSDGSTYAERMRIDSSGNVGIGSSSIAGGSLGVNHAVAGTYPKASGIGLGATSTAYTVASNGGTVSFTGGAGLYAENTASSGNPTNLVFWTNSTGTPAEAMRIDSNGQLLLGTTENVFGGADRYGFNFYANGQSNQSIDGTSGAVAQYINRENDDGAFTEFYKDRAKVGSIGVEGGDLTIGTDTQTGLHFWNNTAIRPWNITANTRADAVCDLGESNTRFKDLHLSGGVVFGATGGNVTSKTLDDYEEGTFTPVVSVGVTSPVYASQGGSYVKIGKLVTFQLRLELSGGTANASHFKIGGLPFTSSTLSNYGGAFFNYSQGFITDIGARTMHIAANGTVISFYKTDGGQLAGTEVDDLTSTLLINGQYEVS